jgi:prevent-host-death family protein
VGGEAEKGTQEASRLIVCDTGPPIHLRQADAIHPLKLAEEIPVPTAVQPGDMFSRQVSKSSKQEGMNSHATGASRYGTMPTRRYAMAKSTVDINELRNKWGEYLRRVKSGETVVVIEAGRPIATIVPAQPTVKERIKAFVDSGAADWNGRRYRPRRPSVHNQGAIQVSDLAVEERNG